MVMKFAYQITEVPSSSENVNSDPEYWRVQGDLNISVGGVLFFEESHQYLLELSILLKRWLIRTEVEITEFNYESVHFEAEPLLRFIPDGRTWKIESVWGIRAEMSVPSECLFSGVKNFVFDLDSELKQNPWIDLDAVYENEVLGYLQYKHPDIIEKHPALRLRVATIPKYCA